MAVLAFTMFIIYNQNLVSHRAWLDGFAMGSTHKSGDLLFQNTLSNLFSLSYVRHLHPLFPQSCLVHEVPSFIIVILGFLVSLPIFCCVLINVSAMWPINHNGTSTTWASSYILLHELTEQHYQTWASEPHVLHYLGLRRYITASTMNYKLKENDYPMLFFSHILRCPGWVSGWE